MFYNASVLVLFVFPSECAQPIWVFPILTQWFAHVDYIMTHISKAVVGCRCYDQVLRVLILRRILKKWSICSYIYNYKSHNEIIKSLFMITGCNILKRMGCMLENTFDRKHSNIKYPEYFLSTDFCILEGCFTVISPLFHRQLPNRLFSTLFKESTQTVQQTQAVPKLCTNGRIFV